MTPRRVDPSSEPATLDAMDDVMQRAYGVSSFRTSINRFVAAQPDGLAVVEHNGSVVGTGCCVAYPDGGFGWIGLVATLPRFERRGIATAITAFLGDVLAGHGCASVLDASAAGGPVYARMGFADCGLTRVLVFAGRRARATKNHRSCAPLTAGDFDEVVAYDAIRFGASRSTLLTALIDQHPGRALVLRRDGNVVGYLIAQETTLAPVIADDPESLSRLLGAALRLHWTSPPRICVPPESGHLDSLLALGFEQRRELRHMQRGIDGLPGVRNRIAGLVSLGEG
ncbi:MAG: GNAT family N-acetyltransferase [Ilumatobacteraceae bacterium]